MLLVRLHLAGFFWGDVSLSNVLFRRSAGEFAAYLVDAETGELHETLTDGQRAHDIDVAVTNIFGELLDLQAGGLIAEEVDAFAIVDRLQETYDALWAELTDNEEFNTDEIWRIEKRIERLNDLGFDVEEVDIVTDWDGASVRVQPRVVEAGSPPHASCRRSPGSTSRRTRRAGCSTTSPASLLTPDLRRGPAVVAHTLADRVLRAGHGDDPRRLRGRLEPAEVYHEILEHRWYLSERAGREVDIFETARDYFRGVLSRRPRRPSPPRPRRPRRWPRSRPRPRPRVGAGAPAEPDPVRRA